MKTRTYHISILGGFAPQGCAGVDGYVIYHDSPRYKKATSQQLNDWAMSRNALVRSAAMTEKADRAIHACLG